MANGDKNVIGTTAAHLMTLFNTEMTSRSVVA